MSLAAGAISEVSVSFFTASLESAVASGGVGPYTYQWYRSETEDFTPGPGNILDGETGLTLDDSGLEDDTTYYYKVVATDTDDDSTAESNQLEVTTLMATTAGALSQVSVTQDVAKLLSAAATAGTSPYTYQWYRSVTTGFTPGVSNDLEGETALSLTDDGLTPGTIYYYKVIATDSSATPVSGTSSQLAVTTLAPTLSSNQFSQTPFLGMLDARLNYNSLPVRLDPLAASAVSYGMALKWSTVASGVPMVLPSTAQADVICGFVNFNMKDQSYPAGAALEMSQQGNVMYLYATAAINRGQKVVSIPAAVAGGCNGGVAPVTGSSGFPIVGFSLDTVIVGQLVRIELSCPNGGLDA